MLRFLNQIDPFFWFLQLTLRRFFCSDLDKAELKFVNDNLQKHRIVLWINAGASVLIVLTLGEVPRSDIQMLITALLAPVMVMGTAWFAISFGSVPQKLIDVSMSITFWMFTAFSVSLSAMMLAIMSVSPKVSWPIWILAWLGAIISCIQYDTTDGLKAGLDDAQLKHSRAALRFYEEKEGIRVE